MASQREDGNTRIKINSVLVCSCNISCLDSPMAGCGEKADGKEGEKKRAERKKRRGREEESLHKKNQFIHIFFYLLHMDTSAVVVVVNIFTRPHISAAYHQSSV